MRDSKWTVYAMAVIHAWGIRFGGVHRIVAPVAHKHRTKALKESWSATVLALPVNLSGTMLVATSGSCTDLL